MKQNTMLLFVSYALSILISRLIFLSNPLLHLSIQNYHIHHLVYGILLLSVSATVLLVTRAHIVHPLWAVAVGTGLGLTFDEFTLWATLNGETYWHPLNFIVFALIGAVILALGLLLKRKKND